MSSSRYLGSETLTHPVKDRFETKRGIQSINPFLKSVQFRPDFTQAG